MAMQRRTREPKERGRKKMMMKRHCRRHVTGTTGRTRTGEDMATARTWADLMSRTHRITRTHICASLQFPQINAVPNAANVTWTQQRVEL